MQSGYTELKTYRYERKFVARKSSRLAVESVLKQNNAFFTPVFQPRQINNIYFDTPGLDCFFDNLFGNGNRWKARIRWYGDVFQKIETPILEFKIKKGFVGTKKAFLLKSFTIDRDSFNASILKQVFSDSNLTQDVLEKVINLQPVLLNTYKRSYYRSINTKFRATIDTDLEYYNLRPSWNHFPTVFKEVQKTVVELKYDQEWDSEAAKITNQFPFRLDKNSKFVAGMSHFKSEIAE